MYFICVRSFLGSTFPFPWFMRSSKMYKNDMVPELFSELWSFQKPYLSLILTIGKHFNYRRKWRFWDENVLLIINMCHIIVKTMYKLGQCVRIRTIKRNHAITVLNFEILSFREYSLGQFYPLLLLAVGFNKSTFLPPFHNLRVESCALQDAQTTLSALGSRFTYFSMHS